MSNRSPASYRETWAAVKRYFYGVGLILDGLGWAPSWNEGEMPRASRAYHYGFCRKDERLTLNRPEQADRQAHEGAANLAFPLAEPT